MTTEERGITKKVILLLGLVLMLVFCSFVVSSNVINMIYFLILLGFMINYIRLKNVK
jgi:hypothetical protein